MENAAWFFLGVTVGIVSVLVFFWAIAKKVVQEDQNHKDDWWKRGEPPPY
jgi:hypothetical protein